jgi:hypothetical protein
LTASSLGRSRRREARASSSLSLERSQRGECGINSVQKKITSVVRELEIELPKERSLTDGENKLDASHCLPSHPIRTGFKCLVDSTSDEASSDEEELQRDHDQSTERSGYDFRLVCSRQVVRARYNGLVTGNSRYVDLD